MLPTARLSVPGLSQEHQDVLSGLYEQLVAKAHRNRLRRAYYDHKSTLKDLGISIPPQMRSVETVIGWPAKAVDTLSRRLILEGFRVAGREVADLGVEDVWDANRLDVEAPQAHTSTLIHGTTFLAVTAGDVQAGEPEAIITARSAEYATGLWDTRKRRLSAALTVLDLDDQGAPVDFVLYVPNRAIIARREGKRWDLRQVVHDLGVPVEPLVYRPMLDRPFGHSRVSRPVMSFTDQAVRTLLRAEVTAEFYSAPQRYALGADKDDFVDESGNPVPAWTSILGRMLAIGRDDEGRVPEVGQFIQATMQPHYEQLRGIAALFAAEANIPLDAMGIVHDNPSSADAIDRSKEELRLDAEWCIRGFKPAWERTIRTALSMRDASPAALAEYRRLDAWFRNPGTPTLASSADAATKLVQVGILERDSEVTYDQMNFSEAQRETLRIEARSRRAREMATGVGVAAAAALTREPVAAAVSARGAGAA